MSDDFMGGMFDFDSSGTTDTGESFMACQMVKEMTGDHSSRTSPAQIQPPVCRRKPDWYTVLIIILCGYALMSAIADLIY